MIKIKELINKPKVKLIIAIIAVLIISFVFLKFAYALWMENNELKAKIKRNRDEITRSEKMASMQNSLNTEIKKISEQISLAEEDFFTNTEEIFAHLNRFTQEVKISLRTVSPGERTRIEMPNQKDAYIELLPVTIKLNCDFSQLLAFLQKIEKFKRIISVDDIRIQNDPQDTWNHNIDIELKTPLLIYAKANE